MNFIREGIRRFFYQSLINYKGLFAWVDVKSYIFMKVFAPILKIVFFSILSSYAFKTTDINTWIIGNSFLLCTSNAIYGVGNDLILERRFGTLRFIVASPYNKFLIFLGRSIFHVIDSFITVVIGLTVGYLFFELTIPLENLAVFMGVLCISLYSAMSIGITISSLGLCLREVHMFLNVSEMSLVILTGASFPISRLPIFLQKISYFTPMSRGIEGARLLVDSYDGAYLFGLILGEFLIGSLFMIIGYLLFLYGEKLSRKYATLDLY